MDAYILLSAVLLGSSIILKSVDFPHDDIITAQQPSEENVNFLICCRSDVKAR